MASSPTAASEVTIVGGGFFGCCLALYHRELGKTVTLVDAAPELLTRASFVNQARVHNGYHYPRSLLTAIRSRVNFPRFVEDFSACVVQDFQKIYAIARNNSKVSAYQFEKFCSTVGAPIEPAPKEVVSLFDSALIEAAYSVTEYAFDAVKLRQLLMNRMAAESIDVRTDWAVKRIEAYDGGLRVISQNRETIESQTVVVATYSRINSILRDSGLPSIPMKHEVAEVALVLPAPELANVGITVMDGPFFSTMPFPARNLFSLTHVRYTPHESWLDGESERDPYAYLKSHPPEPRAIYMLRDAQRYLPAIARSSYVESLFEVKTTLPQNENDDGRPILYRADYGFKGLSVVMGGKIDNIYDILHSIQNAELQADQQKLRGLSKN